MVRNFNQRGFSLLEVIAALVLIAIVGAMVASFMGTQVTHSGRSVTWMKDEFELSEVMERMLADYREALDDGSLNLATFIEDRNTASKINNLYVTTIEDDPLWESTDFQPDTPADLFTTDYTESTPTGDTIQKVTLTKGDQTLITILTE